MKYFNEWCSARNTKGVEECPSDLLGAQIPAQLDKWIATFIAEVHRVDGNPYPPRTIHQLLSGLLRYMCQTSQEVPNILNKKDSRFKFIAGTSEVIYRKLHKDAIRGLL